MLGFTDTGEAGVEFLVSVVSVAAMRVEHIPTTVGEGRRAVVRTDRDESDQALIAHPHRIAVATALAVGLAAAIIKLTVANVGVSSDSSNIAAAPLALLATQTLLVAALAVGFRHAVRLPAELRAAWLFHVAGCSERRYVDGAKRAALVRLALPALAVLFPMHVLALGWRDPAAHLAYGTLLAALFIEAALVGFRALPFASSRPPHDLSPSGNAHARGRSITADFPPTLIRNQQVIGSSPIAGSRFRSFDFKA